MGQKLRNPGISMKWQVTLDLAKQCHLNGITRIMSSMSVVILLMTSEMAIPG